MEIGFKSEEEYITKSPKNQQLYPKLNIERLLDQFSAAFPESLNVLVLYNGRFHQAKSLEIPENVVLLFLLP